MNSDWAVSSRGDRLSFYCEVSPRSFSIGLTLGSAPNQALSSPPNLVYCRGKAPCGESGRRSLASTRRDPETTGKIRDEITPNELESRHELLAVRLNHQHPYPASSLSVQAPTRAAARRGWQGQKSAHFVKILFGHMAWTPTFPSTSWVISTSTATLVSM